MPRIVVDNLNEVFAKRLQERLLLKNIGEMQLAKELDVSHTSIWKYLQAKGLPAPAQLIKISQILDCTIDYLLGRSDDPNIMIVREEQLPKDLRDKNVNAVEVLRDHVDASGGLSEEARSEVLKIVADAKILKHSKPRRPKLDSQQSTDIPPD